MTIRALVFDLGGVILDSPMGILEEFERKNGLSPGFINRLIVSRGEQGAWARLERGGLNLGSFYEAFDKELLAAGADISSRELMEAINGFASLRPRMIGAVRKIRRAGYLAAALTNNWLRGDGSTSTGMEDLQKEFDVFVESSRAGLAKPDPRIYGMVLAELGVSAHEAVFLDDIGRNLKPARQLGMETVRVDSEEGALSSLEELLGLDFGSGGSVQALAPF
ncbi:MAG: HAD family phosphatase [Desulfosalsimonadaceae bacterium]